MTVIQNSYWKSNSNYETYLQEYRTQVAQLLSKAVSKQTLVCYRDGRCELPIKPLTNMVFVFDLDSTAICTQHDEAALQQLGIFTNPHLLKLRKRIYHFHLDDFERRGIGTKYNFWGVTRPHLNELLRFCTNYGRIVVWSAGKRPYVEAIVSHIFKDLPYPELVLTHDDILFDKDGNVIKPLTKVCQKLNVSMKQILAIDDNELTFQQNVNNGILIPAYDPESTLEDLSRDDAALLQLEQWLSRSDVMNTTDVTLLDKRNIFT